MSAWAANRPSPLAATAALILAVLFTGGLLAPWIAPYGLEDMDLMARLVAPFTSSAHILGTDELGRDILTRLLYSLRLSFVLAVCGTLIGAILGTALGFLAARFGGGGHTAAAGFTYEGSIVETLNDALPMLCELVGEDPTGLRVEL